MGIKNFIRNRLLIDNRGSISVLILGMFFLSVITFLVLTDITSVYLAKRALTQVTEASAQRGVKNLDLEKYYASKYNLSSMILGASGIGEIDPGIPIDCAKGAVDVRSTISDWIQLDSSIRRNSLSNVQVDEVMCDGYQMGISTSALARLPFAFSFLGISEYRISAQVGIFDERKVTDNYYGLTIG
ncbi:MAG: hypothetical protein NTY85_05350 [Actinobacteria bacterium]|jgi:hypothetical protein|nr:hypothetical protein [Actinomycetota bacterium]